LQKYINPINNNVKNLFSLHVAKYFIFALEILNKNVMNTKNETPHKKVKYTFKEEEDPFMVAEPFMAMTTLNLDRTKRYTYAEYLTWFDDVRRELIDGFIYMMSAPRRIHAKISMEMGFIIQTFIRKRKRKCQIFHAPFDVRLPIEGSKKDDELHNVVQPDICVVCDLSKLDYRGCIGAPDLMVEVLSPSTMKKDWTKKYALYQEAGVREYWIVDPVEKVVHVFLLKRNGKFDEGITYKCNEKAPVHIFEGLEIDLNELFDDETMR
jgi:Uma2 family endonuclease